MDLFETVARLRRAENSRFKCQIAIDYLRILVLYGYAP
jgi:hypothetical protein